MNNVTNVFEVFQLYNGDTWFLPLILAAVAWLLVRADQRNRRSALLTIGAACLIVFNDIVFRLVGAVMGTETYYRFLWMIPAIPMLAYAVVDVIVLQKTMVRKIAVVIAAVVIVAAAGVPYLEKGSFKMPGQVQYLHDEAEEICNLISADKEKEHPRVACDFSLVLSLRIQDPTIQNAITRQTYLYDDVLGLKSARRNRQHCLLTLVNGGTLDVPDKKIRKMLRRSKTDYIVIATSYDMDEQMLAVDCSVVGRTARHTIYRVE
ncbi:MAG: hypothetical protein Q4F83_07000 [Eubacteriales bacterium]|nr:hypothetical protein [Eubacteriales bacterium]